ncbi:MAG: GTP cyclohydrolase I FolE [Campylobacter sp.]|nr:GTP cyclohydrolase I FolE [Campylobacter sp.]
MQKNRQELFETSVKTILECLGEDINREGLIKTPTRVFKSLEFLTSGYKEDPKVVLNDALFNSSNSEMVLVRDIEFYSLCEHHLLPIIGRAHVAYIPNGKVVGLSKIPRMVNIFARRLQIQEQLTEQIATAIQDVIHPLGVGVVIEARHMCVEMRGVQKINSTTTTSALRGCFIKDPDTRKEFFSLINSPKQGNF